MTASPRPHGTLGRYRKDGCRCGRCRAARRRADKRRAVFGPAYVDATPVREHVEQLLASGMTRHQVAQLAGVDGTQIRHLLVGAGRGPAKGVRPETAATLLAVRPGGGQPAAGATCDATGTRRRLQALMANGWPSTELGRRLHDTSHHAAVLRLLERDRVRSTTAAAVRALYADLADQPGPSKWCRTHYAGRGWLPPSWWDDDALDDPAADPRRLPDTVDEVALDRAVNGEPVPLTRRERAEAVRRLAGDGRPPSEIATRLRMSGGRVRQLLDEQPQLVAR